MSTVLHPVGPEQPRTYWARRVLVVIAITVLVAVIVVLVNGRDTGSAAPPPSSSAVPTPAAASTTPGLEPSLEDSVEFSPDPTAPFPAGSATGSATPRASGQPSGEASGARRSTSAPKSTKTTKPTATTKPAAQPCPASGLRVTLTGAQRLKPKQRSTFQLSVINGTGGTCVASVSPKNFALTVYSGRDRIWSSADCEAIMKPIRRTLEAEDAVAWKLVWNGKRSQATCRSRAEIPKAGTYVATASLAGADAVKLRILLRA